MAKTRMALELGMGTSLRNGDYTRAAVRAVQDALWRNSVSFAEAFGFETVSYTHLTLPTNREV